MQENYREEILRQWPKDAPVLLPAQLEGLAAMMDAYMERMQVCNFTAHRTPERFALFNIIDSILPLLAGHMQVSTGTRVADIGTGGGFPGVPLAVLVPDASFFLFDSVGKKLQVIEDVCKSAEIPNVRTQHLRLEEYGQAAGREAFDVVTSRAVAHWTTLLELALPLVKVGGMFYAYQGEKVLEELAASEATIRFLGGTLEATQEYNLGEGGKRYLICIRKDHKTPADYPRMYGVMLKKPL